MDVYREVRIGIMVAIAAFTVSAGVPNMIGGERTDCNEAVHAECKSISFENLTIEASPRRSNPGQEVTFFINATSDVPGSTIAVLIRFDDRILPFLNNTASPIAFNMTDNPARVVQKFTYDYIGNFSDTSDPFNTRHYFYVRAFAQDDTSGTVSMRVRYYVNNNSAPQIYEITPQASPDPGRPVNLTLGVMDYDNDVLTVTWNFSDGTSAVDTVVTNYLVGFSNKTHQWNAISTPYVSGYWVNLTVNITIYDGHGHWTNGSIPVTIWVPVNYGPTAYMTASDSYIQPPEAVTFHAAALDSEGDGIYWYFDFGDGSFLNLSTPMSTPNTTIWNNQTHLYTITNVSSVNATLHVSDGPMDHNTSSGIIELFVTINRAPVTIIIQHEPEYLEINETLGYINVTFFIMAADYDGDIITATWDMGDGSAPRINTSYGGEFVVYTFTQWRNFTAPGPFNISVTVTDGRDGHEVIKFLNETILLINDPPQLTQAPTWFYDYGDAALPYENLDFTMKVTDNEQDALTVTWDFGDGTPPLVLHYDVSDYDPWGNVTIDVNHVYTVGEYAMKIWITDNKTGYGLHTIQVNATLYVAQPPADAGPDINGLAGQQIEFHGTTLASPESYNYTWVFSYDGELVYIYGRTPVFTFDVPGEYTVSLTISDENGTYGSDDVIVMIQAAPVDELSDSAFVVSVGSILGLFLVLVARRRPDDR